MPICSECLSRDLVKFGKYNNQQRWHCLKCGLTSIYVRKRMPQKGLRKAIRNRWNPKTEKTQVVTEEFSEIPNGIKRGK
jgi:Zn ribbon nucleic-acid-binding protein